MVFFPHWYQAGIKQISDVFDSCEGHFPPFNSNLPTNSLLHKVKKVASPSCPFCPSECQTLWHLFINCMHASSFWNKFQEWYSISSNKKLLLSELEVMFGIIRCHTYCLALNHLIVSGKYFLYVNALNTTTYQFDDFVSPVREKN